MKSHYCREYDDNCEGCQPRLASPNGSPYPMDSPEMKAVLVYWKTVPIEQKQAFHRVCCFNSRVPADLRFMEQIALGMQTAMKQDVN